MLFLIGASTAALTSPGQLASRRAAVFGGLASMLTPPLAAVANDPIGVTGREGGRSCSNMPRLWMQPIW